MHGFVNVAITLRLGDRIDATDRRRCLMDGPDAFVFDDGLAWRGHQLNRAGLADALRRPFTIGSCSLREPDDDLAEWARSLPPGGQA